MYHPKSMRCPVCNQPLEPCHVMDNDPILYQISYRRENDYVSPRCSDCLDKLLSNREEKKKKKEARDG
jgi:uncharacterized protein with PIN domain